jgi:diaminopropionate ammonia-lyase
MAGLNCGIPSELAWPYIKDNVDLFIAITDNYAEKAMKQYYHPIDNDERIISGESGASGLAGMIALFNDKNLAYAKEVLGFNNSSKILIINSEGDTDPVFFKKTIES